MFIRDLSYSSVDIESEQIAQIANAVVQRGLHVPAIFFLELHKPLTRLAHTTLLCSAPLLQFVLGRVRLEVVLQLLSSPENIESLIAQIERACEEEK